MYITQVFTNSAFAELLNYIMLYSTAVLLMLAKNGLITQFPFHDHPESKVHILPVSFKHFRDILRINLSGLRIHESNAVST